MSNQNIETEVTLSPTTVHVSISDQRSEVIAVLAPLSESQRKQLAHEAWFIGSRAVANAQRLADESRLSDIGKSLLEDVDQHLHNHAEQQAKQIHEALARYFDPESGQLSERLRQFTGESGTLPNLLNRHLGPNNSILVETLVKHVGEQSPLFRKLSPTESGGILQLMAERLQKVIAEQHGEFQKALDPLCEEGAVGRFIKRLREELKRAEDDQAKQLKLALAALDTTKEDSLLNQMRRETQQARAELLKAINPNSDNSPLGMIHKSLSECLEKHAKSQQQQLEEARKITVEFQRDIRDAVQRIETRKREEQRSSRGGQLFEDAVLDFVQQTLSGSDYILENTGNVVGLRPNCKVGDAVLRFPPEHAFSDARITIEAKRDKKYTVSTALEELATARKNRDACAGIFVMAKSHAPAGFPRFMRYGQEILVIWDDENPASDPYLQAAVMLGLALAIRARTTVEEGDIQALQNIEQRILKDLERLENIGEAASKIRRQVEIIEAEVEKGTKSLNKVVADAKKTLLALKVELRDEETEKASPIGLVLPANDDLLAPAAENDRTVESVRGMP